MNKVKQDTTFIYKFFIKLNKERENDGVNDDDENGDENDGDEACVVAFYRAFASFEANSLYKRFERVSE